MTDSRIPKQQQLEKLTQRLDRYAGLLDNKFRIPGTDIRFGWDAIIGLIPGVGDSITLLLSAVILVEAKRIGAPKSLLLKMAGNMGLEWLIGLIPLLGDLFDVYWKANIRNMELLKDYLQREQTNLTLAPPPEPGKGWYWSLIVVGALFMYLIVASLMQLPIY